MRILLQGALLQCSEEEFDRAIKPSLQIAQALLEKSTIPDESEQITIKSELELVLIRLIKSVQNESIPKKDALDRILAIKKALLEYRNKQYTSTWQWLISPTPEIVKTKVKPALYQVNTALSTLNQSILNSYTVAAAIIAIIMARSIIIFPNDVSLKIPHNETKNAFRIADHIVRSSLYSQFTHSKSGP